MTGFEISLQWGIFAIVTLAMAARRQLTIFHPTSIYLTFHCIVFCIRPTFVHFFGFDQVWRYIGFWPTEDEMRLALYLSSSALLVFCAAFAVTCPHPGPKDLTPAREFTLSEKRAFWLMVVILAPLGVYSIVAANATGENINGVFVMTGTSGYLNDLQQVLISITILIIVMCRWRWYSFIPLLAFLSYRATQGWGRWTILLTVFALILFHSWEHRKNLPSWKFILPLPLVFILFMNLGLDRSYVRNLLGGNTEETRDVLDENETFTTRFDTLDFANFDYLTYIVAVVPRETETYTYASQYLQIFTEPIPRKLWKNKPVGAPVSFFNLNDYGNFNGLTPALVGDGWMSGGWIGALFTMGFAGWALGMAYNWFVRYQTDFFRCFTFLIINAVIVQLFRDGGISIAKFLLFSLLPILVWKFLASYVFPGSPDALLEEDLPELETTERDPAIPTA